MVGKESGRCRAFAFLVYFIPQANKRARQPAKNNKNLKNRYLKWHFPSQVPFFTKYILSQMGIIVNRNFVFSVTLYQLSGKDYSEKSIIFY